MPIVFFFECVHGYSLFWSVYKNNDIKIFGQAFSKQNSYNGFEITLINEATFAKENNNLIE